MRGVEPARAADAGEHRDVLLAVEAIRARRRDDAGPRAELPELLAAIRAIGDEAPVVGALEDEIAGGRQRAAADRPVVHEAPARLAGDRIPRDQRARRGRRSADALFVGR